VVSDEASLKGRLLLTSMRSNNLSDADADLYCGEEKRGQRKHCTNVKQQQAGANATCNALSRTMTSSAGQTFCF
jgi:hypothetical protein